MSTARRTSGGSHRAPKSSRRALKDPRGGLTAAGRAWFARREGAHLKPGVKKPQANMSLQDMHRKGSWAVRFYGREGSLPPLRKPDGEPTRYALSAAAWGEPVPATVAAARRIAAKGHRLLAAYAKAKEGAGSKKVGRKSVDAKGARGRSAHGKSASQSGARNKTAVKKRAGRNG